VARTVSSIFIRGLGGFGGPRGPTSTSIQLPTRAPDAIQLEKTSDHQAWIYRLSADYNPLHIDPAVAEMVGFKKPILHGLCTFGFSTRAILKCFCNNDPANFKSIRVRFISPVYPGETLVTEMWKEGKQILFQTKVQERNVIVIGNASAEIIETNSKKDSSLSSEPELKSAIVFAAMEQALEKHPDLVKKINGVFQFNLTGPHPTTYVVDVKNGKGAIIKGPPPASIKPDCIMTVSDEDYFEVATGKLDSQVAFLKGKIKISGNIFLAQKLNLIQTAAAKL